MAPLTTGLSKAAALMVVGTSSAFSIPRGRKRGPRHPSPLSSQMPNTDQQRRMLENEEECLIPEANPNSDPNATSLSGVRYLDVASGIDALYPPTELSSRNAKSRTDGYWAYVERGEKPPQELTYGEFDIEFFGMLLDNTWEHYVDGMVDDANACGNAAPWINKTFCDIGSGAGRLVLTAAALHPGWKLCRGLEILHGLHEMSMSIADGCRLNEEERTRMGISDDECFNDIIRIPHNDSSDGPDETRDNYLPLAPIRFTCRSFTDPYEYLGDIDCAFVFSSCMKADLVRELSLAIGRQCKPGTIIVTTEFPLHLRGTIDPVDDDPSIPHGQYEIQLIEKVDGWCWLMGGVSTAYIHRVKTTLWEEYAGPRERRQLLLEEEAYRLVQAMESGELTDTPAFLRRVRNDMIFNGVPPEFMPDLDDEPK